MNRKPKSSGVGPTRWRAIALLVCFALGGVVLEGRMLYLQLIDNDFLAAQGDDKGLHRIPRPLGLDLDPRGVVQDPARQPNNPQSSKASAIRS